MTVKKAREMICLTPYKELMMGEESILNYVIEGYEVPDKVIAYLRIPKPYLMSPGIYDHPFKKGMRLLGPYLYTDDAKGKLGFGRCHNHGCAGSQG